MRDVEILNTNDEGSPITSDQLSKKGLPRWLAVIPLVAIAALVLAVQNPGDTSPDSRPTTQANATTTSVVSASEEPAAAFDEGRTRGNEAERLGLLHGTHDYAKSGGTEGTLVVALRSGSDLLVINSDDPLAHRIQLPGSSAQLAAGEFTMALLLDKLVVADGDVLRSLSVQGGVDLLLADNLLGFQVDGPRLIVAAETADARFPDQQISEIRVQGVHADFFGVPGEAPLPHGSKVVATGGQVFVELGGQVFVPTAEGLRLLRPGQVIAAGPNHVFIRDCTASHDQERQATRSCTAVKVGLAGGATTVFEEPPPFGAATYIVSPTGEELFVLNDGSGIQGLVSIGEDGAWTQKLAFDSPEVSAAAFTPDGEMLLTVSDNQIDFWIDGESVGEWTISDFGEITEVTVAR